MTVAHLPGKSPWFLSAHRLSIANWELTATNGIRSRSHLPATAANAVNSFRDTFFVWPAE